MAGGRTRCSPRPWAAWAAAAALLGTQHLVLFGRHYFGGWTMPWDFMATYHAVPHYWVEAARAGVSSAWIPFQGMGYPLYMNLQSGHGYLPFWLFVWGDQPYTVRAAIVTQGLHVLFGAGGIALAARLAGMRWVACLVAALGYQCFAGFYSHASHPDIVRAYSLLPWVMAPALARWPGGRLLHVSIAFTPLWLYGLWAGGYPGTAIAQTFAFGLILAARLAFAWGDVSARRVGLLLAAAGTAGLLLPAFELLPAMLARAELARSTEHVEYAYLEWHDLLALVLPLDDARLAHDVTMRGSSITLPLLLLLLARLALGRWRDAAWTGATAVLGVAMAAGLVHPLAARALPPLGYSRFPIADYAAVIAVACILLGTQSLSLVRKRMGTANRPVLIVLALAVLVTADWLRLHWDAPYFYDNSALSLLEGRIGPLSEARRRLNDRLAHPPDCRPARTHVAAQDIAQVPWRGYYTGEYMTQDYSAAANLLRLRAIVFDPVRYDFALKPWVAVLADGTQAAGVRCVRYGTDMIEYAVDLARPVVVTENEVYWPGWTAEVEGRRIVALDARGFRSWQLPAGRYRMVARFAVPHEKAGILTSMLGVVLWSMLLVALTRMSSDG